MRFVTVILFCLSMMVLPALYRNVTKGFRIDKFWVPERSQKGQSFLLTPEIREILNQDFYYLKQGTQSYVFESEDRKYVIKLFRYEQARNIVYRFIKTKIRNRSLRSSKHEQTSRLLTACQIAETRLKAETALVALHLQESDHIWPCIQVHGPLGRTYTIYLDKVSFAIQKKGDLIFTALSTANPVEMNFKLRSLYDLLRKRKEERIVNLDRNLSRNIGFVGNQAIEIDFGAYDFASEEEAKRDFKHFSESVQNWLKKQAPESVLLWEELLNGS